MKRCIVIGCGIAGLAAAIRMRAKGYEVTVFESNDFPGGKLREFRAGGYRFDAGPSLFTMPHFVDELFVLSEEKPEEHFRYVRLDNGCNYFYGNGIRFSASSDPEKLATTLADKLGEDAGAVHDHLKRSGLLYRITAPVFLERSLHRLSTYLRPEGLKGILNLWRIGMFRTMHMANETRFRTKEAVQFFDRFATYNGSDPYRAPSTLNVIPHLEFGFGTFFPEKGMYHITESLYQLALRKGVRFLFGERVDKITLSGKRVCGVISGGTEHSADVVISNMDIRYTYSRLLPGLHFPARIKKQESSSSALIFYWGIKAEFPELDLHNVFFSDAYRDEFGEIFRNGGISDDPTVYINITSKYKKDDAPEGCENWFVMINAPANKGQDWDKLIEKARSSILDKLGRMLGRDISTLIEHESVLDPRGIESVTSSYQGALYGSSSNKLMSAFFRQANFHADVKGLYFCGGSVHPGGGIPLCMLGAKIVSGMIR